MSTHAFLFGQNAVESVLAKRGGKATPEEIAGDMKELVRLGLTSESMTGAPLNRALNAMARSYKLRRIMDKRGHVLFYELTA